MRSPAPVRLPKCRIRLGVPSQPIERMAKPSGIILRL